MARTTIELVGAIIEVDEDIVLTPWIELANELVTEVCTDSGYTDSRLEKIETFLAAHLYASTIDPRAVSEGVTGANVSYQSSVSLGFNNTQYGQAAMRADTKGNLAALDKKILKGGGTGQIVWLGETVCEEQEDYQEGLNCEDGL